MKQDFQRIISLLKQGAGGVTHLLELLDRHLIDVPLDKVMKHPLFTQLRYQDPESRALMESSLRETGGPVYWPCVYAEIKDDLPAIYVVDGHQRLDAARTNGDKTIIVQYFPRWTSPDLALADAVSAQWAKIPPVQADVVSLLRTGKLTQADLARKTGLGESTISRLAKVAKPELDWLYSATQKEILPLGTAGKLVDACNENGEKLTAIQNTFEDRLAEAEEERKYWDNHMKSHKRKWDRRTKEKARISTYFKGVDWSTWIDALEADDGIERVNGRLLLKVDPDADRAKAGVRIGDAKEWQDEIAVYNLFGAKRDEIDPADIDVILADWDHIRDCLIAVRDGKPVPSVNPIKRIAPPAAPQPQKPAMRIEGSADDAQ